MIKTTTQKLERIRDLSIVAEESSLPKGYTGDVKRILRQIRDLSISILKTMEETNVPTT